jgi:hypothetical protein
MKEAQKELVFTRRVLGPKASDRLEKHLVTQTLRSKPLIGESVPVRLRYRGQEALAVGIQVPKAVSVSTALGNVTLKSVDRVKWADLTFEDPHRGGFDDMEELAAALKRAGLFKPLEEYSFFRIRFSWNG